MLAYFELLGYKVKDKVTGFEGIAVAWGIDLYGCITVLVNPGSDKDGKLQDQTWFDAKRLTKTGKVRVMDLPNIGLEAGKERGGDRKPSLGA